MGLCEQGHGRDEAGADGHVRSNSLVGITLAVVVCSSTICQLVWKTCQLSFGGSAGEARLLTFPFSSVKHWSTM